MSMLARPPGGADERSAPRAKQVMPTSTLPHALCIVFAFRALVIVAGKVGLPPPVRGDAALPIIVAYTVPSGAVVLPQSLLDGSRWLPVPVTQDRRWRHPAFVRDGTS